MKANFDKRLNKIIVGAVLGTTILGLGGFAMSGKGKGFWEKLKEKSKKVGGFFKLGLDGIKSILKK